MKKMLTSVWFALAIGMVGFGATLGVLWMTSGSKTEHAGETGGTNAVAHAAGSEGATNDTHATAQAAAPEVEPEEPEPVPQLLHSAEAGELTFNNPEVAALLEELKIERDQLKQRARELSELEKRIEAEKAYIGSITQKFLEAKALILRDMTNRLTVVYDKETNKLRQLAMIYTNMPPSNAVAILNKMEVDNIARILEYMKEAQKASILENFATNELTRDSGKATEISERLRRVAPEPKLSTPPETQK